VNERAARPLPQLGWAILGATLAGCVAAMASTFVVYASSFAAVVGLAYLAVVIPVSVCIAVVLWAGYVAGGRIATRRTTSTSVANLTSAFLALALGTCVILVSNIFLDWFHIPYWPWACFGALLGGTASVLLARHLPRRRLSGRTGWESTFGE